MNADRQILNAVANIQDELTRISTVAGLLDSKIDGNSEEFQKKIVSEFNVKLRNIKKKNRSLQDENTALRLQVRHLEAQLSGNIAVPESSFKSNVSMAPPTRSTHKDRVVILSSPIKNSDEFTNHDEFVRKTSVSIKDGREFYKEESNSPVKGRDSRNPASRKQFLMDNEQPKSDVTSSQFNGLPTQYSDSSSQNHGLAVGFVDRTEERNVFVDISPPKKKRPKIGDIDIVNFVGEDDENPGVVADSQDEFEPLRGSHPGSTNHDSGPKYPPHYTALQRVEFLRLYYQSKKKDSKFIIDLRKNPISEKVWALDDFVPNPKWKPAAKMNTNLGTMTKYQEKAYRDFFNEAGLGKKMAGPVWDSNERDNGDDLSWSRSQVMNKYSSPPGYMTGDFVDTQEAKEQKKLAMIKQQDRIKRRFASVLAHGEFIFYEDILNFFVQTKRYTNAQPVFSKV